MDRRTDMGFLDPPYEVGEVRHLAIILPATSHGEGLDTTLIPRVAGRTGLTGDHTVFVTMRPFAPATVGLSVSIASVCPFAAVFRG
jgi:hypothetical protein